MTVVTASKSSANQFFEILNKLNTHCHSADPSTDARFAKVINLFAQTLSKHGPFNLCSKKGDMQNGRRSLILECSQTTTGPKDLFIFSTGPHSSNLRMEIPGKAEGETVFADILFSEDKTEVYTFLTGSTTTQSSGWKPVDEDNSKTQPKQPNSPKGPQDSKPDSDSSSSSSGFDSSYIKIGAGIAGIAAAILFACKSQSRNSKKDSKTEELPQSGLQTAKLSSTT